VNSADHLAPRERFRRALRRLGDRPALAGLVVLVPLLALGMVLWDRWGWLIAFDALMSFCFG
jgi:hypothetical protein